MAGAWAATHADKNAKLVEFEHNQKRDGQYSWQYESDNQIISEEAGAAGAVVIGSTQYYAPDGDGIHLTYIADQDGYRATGDHLPTPPPTPELILRGLEYLRKHAPKRPDESIE